MSIFGNIMSAIFGRKAEAPDRTWHVDCFPEHRLRPAGQNVDVEAVLTGWPRRRQEKLDWRKSIVDLMKLLDLDSSLTARKELAKELGYTGDIERLRQDEHLAAQAGDEEARRERRQGSSRPHELGGRYGYL